MAEKEVIPFHRSGVGDAVDHWIRVVHEQRAENASLRERLYFDSRIADAADAWFRTLEECADADACVEKARAALGAAVQAKRDHIAAETARAGKGEGR